jgi:hypothetical protein
LNIYLVLNVVVVCVGSVNFVENYNDIEYTQTHSTFGIYLVLNVVVVCVGSVNFVAVDLAVPVTHEEA